MNYKGDSESLGNAVRSWDNPMCGGTVLQPTGSKPKGKREKYNPLKQDIEDLQVDYLYGGGFYRILHAVENTEETYGGEEDGEQS